jgi:HlyD family secretion protein
VREKDRLEKKTDVEDPPETEEDEDETKEEEMIEVVFVVENEEAFARAVKLGISDDTHYAISSGLSDSDMVITGPFKLLNKNLNTGDKVTVKSKKK